MTSDTENESTAARWRTVLPSFALVYAPFSEILIVMHMQRTCPGTSLRNEFNACFESSCFSAASSRFNECRQISKVKRCLFIFFCTPCHIHTRFTPSPPPPRTPAAPAPPQRFHKVSARIFLQLPIVEISPLLVVEEPPFVLQCTAPAATKTTVSGIWRLTCSCRNPSMCSCTE